MNKLYLTGIGIPANNDLVCLAEDFALCRCIYVYSPKSKIGECISFRKVVHVYVNLKFQVYPNKMWAGIMLSDLMVMVTENICQKLSTHN